MSLRKYLHLLFACTLVFAMACGGGKEVVDEKELGEDDGAIAENTAGDTANTAAAATAASAPVLADAATLNGVVKFEGAAPKMPPLQMGADPYCASQHQGGVSDEEVMVGPGGELANVIVFVKNAPGNYPAPTTP